MRRFCQDGWARSAWGDRSLTTATCGYLGEGGRTGRIVPTAINTPSQPLVVCDVDFWGGADKVNFTFVSCFVVFWGFFSPVILVVPRAE